MCLVDRLTNGNNLDANEIDTDFYLSTGFTN